jgi:hypothetical protein
MTALVLEITGKQPFNSTEGQPRRKRFLRRSTFPDQESSK